ncbi:MAG: hypothetical protein GF309_11590 [Candidatus Lokiarchaeota archaeon]|nr:hypothetical protein [Candidatus Lokiarchaeota archaeon]
MNQCARIKSDTYETTPKEKTFSKVCHYVLKQRHVAGNPRPVERGDLKQWGKSLTPWQIAAIMFLVTLLAPLGSYCYAYQLSSRGPEIRVSVYAMMWALGPGTSSDETRIFGVYSSEFRLRSLNEILTSSPLWMFNVFFAIQIVRFCKDEASKHSALILGPLTLLVPTFMTLVTFGYVMRYIMTTGHLVWVGPAPIQLVVGLLLMKYSGPWKITKIWDDEPDDKQ